MAEKINNIDSVFDYWIVSSKEDFKTMEALYSASRNSWALFLGHLVIEKLLKAYFVKRNMKHPPFTHNLLKLAKESKLDLTEELKVNLVTITAFNLNTRYDDYKHSFNKKCTKKFTDEWINKVKEVKLWIEKQIN